MYKIIKKSLCFLISIMFCIPSIAAMTSDGSAFVTKAEFDSALADFNSRLTSFEAGMNAKIDSQVTSYLDRNGIWKKSDQTMSSTSMSVKILSSDIQAAQSGVTGTVSGNKVVGPYTWVANTTKAGLVVGSWFWKNKSGVNSNNTRWGWSNTKNSAGTWASDSGLLIALNILEVKNGKTDADAILKYSNAFLSNSGTDNSNGGSTAGAVMVPLCASAVRTPVQFFVDKNSKLLWNVRCIYRIVGSSAFSCSGDGDSALYVEMENAYIY